PSGLPASGFPTWAGAGRPLGNSGRGRRADLPLPEKHRIKIPGLDLRVPSRRVGGGGGADIPVCHPGGCNPPISKPAKALLGRLLGTPPEKAGGPADRNVCPTTATQLGWADIPVCRTTLEWLDSAAQRADALSRLVGQTFLSAG